MKENKLAFLFLLTIPWVMAFSSVAGFSIGSIRHTGLYWMISFVVGIMILPLKRGKITFPMWSWLPFYAYMGISLFWTRFDLRDNLQFYIQISVFPIIGCIASYAVTTIEDMNRFRPAYLAAIILIGLFCVYYMHGPGQSYQHSVGSIYAGFAERPAAVSLIVVAAMFISSIRVDKWYSFSVWCLCFFVGILSESRMATFVLVAMWFLHPNFGTLASRFVASFFVIVFGLMAFNTSIIQRRFFNREHGFSGSGTIWDVLQGKFDSAGRFDSWPLIFERSFDYFWFGHGVGESPPFVFRVWAPMDKPHNEYLRMFYEGGMIGVAAFIFGLLGTLVNLIIIMRKTKEWNWPVCAAFMSWIGFILMAIVDNPLVYGNNFLHIAFFLVGAANGIYAKWLNDQREAAYSLSEEEATEVTEASEDDDRSGSDGEWSEQPSDDSGPVPQTLSSEDTTESPAPRILLR